MKYECLSAADLTDTLRARWTALQNADESLASPHFSVDFFQHVAAVRPGSEVVVVRQGVDVVGFVPLHRAPHNVALPIAGRLSDLQGAVLERHVELDLGELIRACGLKGLVFHDWVLEQSAVQPHCAARGASPFIDLRGGFEDYYRARRAAGGDELQNLLRKGRKVAREMGPLRLEPYVTDREIFEMLLAWKAEQLESRRQATTLTESWQAALLWRVLSQRQPQFAGMLSALYAGDHLLAITIGMRSQTLLNGWVTAYNTQFAKYSPGMLLLIELARAAPDLGIQRIDMGRGSEGYKQIFRSGTTETGEGAVFARRWKSALHAGRLHTREWLRDSRWGSRAEALSRRVRFALSQRAAKSPRGQRVLNAEGAGQ